MTDQFPPPPGAPAYPPPQHPFAPPPQQPGNGLAVAGLVCGIVGLVLFWIPVLSWILGILGLVFGIIGRRKAIRESRSGAGMGLAGAITGGIALVIGVIFFIAILNAADDFDNYFDCVADPDTTIEECEEYLD